MSNKLLKILSLKGKISVLTGLHIGSGNETVEIGGSDSPVIKDYNGFPYIPGSSLKGRMRSLLEVAEGSSKDGAPSSDYQYSTTAIFGCGEAKKVQSPTRIIFQDCFLTDQFKSDYIENKWHLEFKQETAIDRLKGTAKTGSLRNAERVPAGVEFNFDIKLTIFEGDDEKEFKAVVEKGLDMMEKTYLGGRGSRGYGRVKFSDRNWQEVWSNK